MSISSLENSPIQGICGTGSVSDCDQETHSPVSVCSSDHAPQSDRPERMREWIIRMINSGRFPGLEWINKEKDVFRVPWIHAKKRGYDRKRDAAIFREWAIHSGKYREDGDPTTWKINFRCAINGLKDIMEIKDMQQEDCRVYKVLPSRGRMRRRRPISVRHEPYPASCTAPTYPGIPDGASHFFHMPSTTAHPPLMNPSYQTNIKLEPFDSTMIPYQPISRSGTVFSSCAHEPSMFYSYTGHIPEHLNLGEASYPDLQSHMQEHKFHPLLPPPSTILSNKTSDVIPLCRHDSPDSGIGTDPRSSPLMSHSSPQHSPAAVMSQGQNSPIQQHSPLLSQQNSPLQSQPSPVMTSCSIGVPSPASVVSSTPLIDDGNEVAQFFDELESNPSSSPLPSTPPPPSNEVNIRVFYGSIPIHSENVDCTTSGCKIFANGDLSRSDDDMISNCFGPTGAHTICLPDSHAHPAAKQVFGAMKRGILIESRDGNIYVTPLCRTMVYCGNSSSDPAVSLEKEKCSKVFDYNACFRPALDHYAFNPGKSPNPYFILSLGQTWGPGRHVTENLVSIVVTHSRAKHEIEAIGLTHLLTKDLLIDMPDTVDIDTATETDLEAEAFFKRCQNM